MLKRRSQADEGIMVAETRVSLWGELSNSEPCPLAASSPTFLDVLRTMYRRSQTYGRRPNPTPYSNPLPNPDPKPQPKRAKLAINTPAPRLHRTRKFHGCGRRFRSADHATHFSSQKHRQRSLLPDCCIYSYFVCCAGFYLASHIPSTLLMEYYGGP